jgi:hypothetical protein
MAQMVRRARRVIVVDPMHNFNAGPVANRLPGFVIVRSIPELVALLRRVRGGNFRIICQLGLNYMEEFEAILKLALELRNCTLAVDEMWQFCKPTWMPGPLGFIARAWRHRGITLIYTVQRPQLVAADLRENTTQWRLFQLQGQLALDALRGRVADGAIRELPQLPKYWHIHANDREQWRRVKP